MTLTDPASQILDLSLRSTSVHMVSSLSSFLLLRMAWMFFASSSASAPLATVPEIGQVSTRKACEERSDELVYTVLNARASLLTVTRAIVAFPARRFAPHCFSPCGINPHYSLLLRGRTSRGKRRRGIPVLRGSSGSRKGRGCASSSAGRGGREACPSRVSATSINELELRSDESGLYV